RSISPARRCSASRSAGNGPSRTGRSNALPSSSLSLPYQIDENVFERALGRFKVAEPDAGLHEVAKQRSHAGPLALSIVGVDDLPPVFRKHPAVGSQRVGNF